MTGSLTSNNLAAFGSHRVAVVDDVVVVRLSQDLPKLTFRCAHRVLYALAAKLLSEPAFSILVEAVAAVLDLSM